MSLRLLRRRPAPPGRHSRAVPGPLVPGAAAALVAAADPWDQPPAYAEEPVAEADTAPVDAALPQPLVPPVAPVGPILLVPESAPVAPLLGPPVAVQAAPASPTRPAVSLGFADGALVDLPADDPRVRTFAAAAAAMLEPHRG